MASELFPGMASLLRTSGNIFANYRGAMANRNILIAPSGNWYNKRVEQYVIMQAAYDGTIFKDNRKWKKYLNDRDLHEKTMCVINPTQRVCDFYASHIYPGYLSVTGFPEANNVPLAIPISSTSPQIRPALAQMWEWSNWQQQMVTWIRTCAALGDCPIEVVDNVKEGKVYASVLRPEYITDIRVDDTGTVTYYVKQNEVWDDEKKEYYQYVRVVDLKTITTYKNGAEFGYNGDPASYPNPYGFVPLVWCKHRDPGNGIFPGLPAIRDWGKIEEYNSDYTRIRMFIRKQALTPQLLTGMGEITPYLTEEDGSVFDIEDMLLMTAAENGSVHKLEGNLSIAESLNSLAVLKAEIEDDHPELKAHSDLTNMSQSTGPSTKNILANVTHLIQLASVPYDKATVDLHKMLLAIAGQRANERRGGWFELNTEQKKFLPYTLDSIKKGNLDFAITPRDVQVKSILDLAEEKRQKYISYAAGARAGLPLRWQLKKEGFTDEEINEILSLQEEEFKKELRWAKELQEASAGASATLQPQLGKDSIIGGTQLIGKAKPEAGKPANPGSQSGDANTTAKSITSKQVN